MALVAVAGAHSLGLPPFAGKNASQQNAVAVPGATSASGQPGAGQVPAASGSAAPASAPPAGLGSGWKQTFNATFTGSTLDSSVWDTCYPWESQQGCANFGNSDEEFQWYQPSQDSVANGTLNLTAQAATTEGTTSGGSPEQYPYRSGLVTTHPGYSYQYGYLQVVAKVPTASGLWTALWLAASNEQWPPEIDILEHWDNQPKYFQYYHPSNAPREDSYITRSSLGSGYHTYGLDWTASKVAWYIDGRQVFETGRNVPQQPMYFLANVAVDAHVSSLPASTSQLSIKSVTVWQQGG